MERSGMILIGENPCPSAALQTTWSNLGAKPGLRGEKPATNRLSYDTPFCSHYKIKFVL
jgi:hypothetical protein